MAAGLRGRLRARSGHRFRRDGRAAAAHRRQLADAAIDGLNAGYANTGFVGFPLVMVTLGGEAMSLTLIATILTVCVLFAVAIVLIEVSLRSQSQSQTSRRYLAFDICKKLLRNPLLVAPVVGAIVPISGFDVPAPAESFLKLLGGAASPCALVALGLFLAENRGNAATDNRTATLLVIFKLVMQPAVTWILATAVFDLPPLLTHAAVLLAALPTGTGPFMLAEFYGREAAVTSTVVLASTVTSVMTISSYLAFVM